MGEEVDLYAVLKVPPDATQAQIRSAYHQAVRRTHPDAGGSAEEFRRVAEAYETLSDPSARRNYDARAGRPGHGADADARSAPVRDSEEPPEPDWGREVDWNVPPWRVWVEDEAARRASNPDERSDSWVHHRAGQQLVHWGATVGVALGAFLAYVLIARDSWIRPEAATSDLWGWFLEHTIVQIVVMTFYVFLMIVSFAGFVLPALVLHVLSLLGLAVWPVAYWSSATPSERVGFVLVAFTFLIYAAIMTIVPSIILARYRPDNAAS